MSLADALTDETKKPLIVKDCCELIDAEVKDKGGISGLAIKAGYGTVKGIKPGFVEKAVDDLLPEFAKALDPIYADAKSQNKPVADFFARTRAASPTRSSRSPTRRRSARRAASRRARTTSSAARRRRTSSRRRRASASCSRSTASERERCARPRSRALVAFARRSRLAARAGRCWHRCRARTRPLAVRAPVAAAAPTRRADRSPAVAPPAAPIVGEYAATWDPASGS